MTEEKQQQQHSDTVLKRMSERRTELDQLFLVVCSGRGK